MTMMPSSSSAGKRAGSVPWMNATDSEMEADLRLTWWEDGRVTLYAVWKGKEWSFSVPPDAVDVSPEGYSFEGAVREAKRLLEEDKRSRFELARETLQAAFPYDELIAQGEIVEADLRLGEGGETVIAAAAVIDGGNARVTYFADLYGDAPVHTVCHNLVPSWAEKVVIETPCRVDREDEYGTWNYARFEAGSIRYTVELTYDQDDRLYAYGMELVTAAKRNADGETAASGGNREELLGQRPARCECRPRHEADAGSRNPMAEAILNQNYELFTYPCLRWHKLLRLSGAAQRAQRGGHLSGCTGSGAGLTARYQGLQPHRCRGARAGLPAEFSRRHPHPATEAAAGAQPASAAGYPGVGGADRARLRGFPRPVRRPYQDLSVPHP